MPTVILLDNSLSMCRVVANQSDKSNNNNSTKDSKENKNLTKRDLAHSVIRRLVDHVSKNDKFEYLGLVAFSSTAQIISEFTRDYQKLLDSLESLKIGDSSCLEEGLNKVSDLVIDEWACFTNVHILLITDDLDNFHQNSVRNLCTRLKENRVLLRDYYLSIGIDFDERIHVNSILNEDMLKSSFYANLNKKTYFTCKFPFSFPNRFDIICLSEYNQSNVIDLPNETNKIEFIQSYGFDDENFKLKILTSNQKRKSFFLDELIQLNNSIGCLYETKNLNRTYVENEFCDKIFNDLFNPFECKLKCGHLESDITLIPSPIPFKGYQNFCFVTKEISRNLDICGFIGIADLTTPPTISRHLIVDNDKQFVKSECYIETGDNSSNTGMIVDETSEDQTLVSFAVLLHSSLKSENMSAIVNLGNDWYGAVHCWQDSKTDPKKKSNLMLTIFVPGSKIIQSIISKVTQSIKPNQSTASSSQVSNRQLQVKSYTKGCIVWYRPDNLVSDLQKIVRNAKKMQDKLPMFFKELNRVRKAALSLGFYELFEGLAQMLQRELGNSINTNNPETILQLNHCINCLRSPEYKDYSKDIKPFISNAAFNRKIQK